MNAKELKEEQKRKRIGIQSRVKASMMVEIPKPIQTPVATHKKLDSERILEDDYPVYFGYVYIMDGIVQSSPIQGTVGSLKVAMKVKQVMNCDIFGHDKLKIGDKIEIEG